MPLNDDHIKMQMAHQLRQTVDQSKEMEQELKRKSDEERKLMERIKMLEQSLNVYQNQDKERLQKRYQSVIKPFVDNVKSSAPDEETRTSIERFGRNLQEQIEKPTYDADTVRTLAPQVEFVSAVASASQIQSSKYEEYLQRERDLRKQLQERDELLKSKDEEYSKTKGEIEAELNKIKEEKEAELKRLKEQSDAELAKMKEELEKTKMELSKSSESIANTEKHFEKVNEEQPQDDSQQVPMDISNPATQQVPHNLHTGIQQSQGMLNQYAGMNSGMNFVPTVAGSTGVGSASDMYAYAKPRPTTDWRTIGMNVNRNMFSDNVYKAFQKDREY